MDLEVQVDQEGQVDQEARTVREDLEVLEDLEVREDQGDRILLGASLPRRERRFQGITISPNAVRMIQPFYSDGSSVEKARTFWEAFERATEGLSEPLRLSAFRECLKGKSGEEWWTHSQINDFETLRTRFHNQFVCQTPLQMIERLKTTKRSKGMSAEVWGDQ
ncbi:hypothetical protein F444_07011, partial [Phytophthora nicotianae P1976]